MEVMGHFIFEIIKIVTLGSVYAGLLLVVITLLANINFNAFRKLLFIGKWRLFKIIFSVISPLLFVFMFTYWGDHGLGDSATIPVGYNKVVNRINNETSYLENDRGRQLEIKDFIYNKNHLFAALSKDFVDKGFDFIVWDLSRDEWRAYSDRDYLNAVNNKRFPSPKKFKYFDYHYSRYWNGWRFWFLP